MTRYPEPIEQIRHVEPVQHARGGVVTRVTMRLDNGRAVSFYEVAIGGQAITCDSRTDAFDVIPELEVSPCSRSSDSAAACS